MTTAALATTVIAVRMMEDRNPDLAIPSVPDSPEGGQGGPDGQGGPGTGAPPLAFPARVSVRRADDFLVCDLVFQGFTFREGPPRLERATDNAHIIVDLPPQSFGEQAYLEVAHEVQIEATPPDKLEVSSHPGYPDKNVAGGDEPTPPELPAARVRMSGRSRVAISMPAGTSTIAFDLPSMLAALRDWPMRLDFNASADPLDPSLLLTGVETVFQLAAEAGAAPAATPAAAPAADASAPGVVPAIDLSPIRPFLLGPHEPAASVTALELPYRLVVSPLDPAGWQHSVTPVAHHGRTELWHTRLTTAKTPAGIDEPGRVRALWSPDYRPPEKFDELIRLVSADPDAEPPDTAGPNPNLLRLSLDPVDRSMLVTLMAGFDATRNGGESMYHPRSSEAKRLHLSALGALLDAKATGRRCPTALTCSNGVTSRRLDATTTCASSTPAISAPSAMRRRSSRSRSASFNR